MKMVKSLILGSAAGLLAMGGAQAADLPVKAKAVEYVKICSLYGAGFYYIPGTDTCIKLGGYIRVDVLSNTNSDDTGNFSSTGGAQNRFTDGYLWRSRADFNIDTRTATEYGVVRTFADVVFTWTDDSYTANPNGNGSTIYSALGGNSAVSPGANANNGSSGLGSAGSLGVYYAFIQFAGFTIGKAISPFSAPWQNYPGNNFDGLVGGGGAVTGVNQFIYTADFGNGLSATVGFQDQDIYYQAGVNNLSAGGLFGTSDYANNIVPDIIGVIKLDQAWGGVQGSVAAHDNHTAYYTGTGGSAVGGTEIQGHPDDKWGFAVQGALWFKNLPTGAGDTLNLQAVYTNGATKYNIQDLSGANSWQFYSNSNTPGIYQKVGIAAATDTIFANGFQQQLTETWGGRGGFNHNWDPYWSTSVYGAYAAIRYNSTAQFLICGVGFAAATFVPGGCNPNYEVAQAGIITRWTPVKGLTFSGDFSYTHLEQHMNGFIQAGSLAVGKPNLGNAYQFANQDSFLLLLRAQRNW
jgi:hypothetical protein